MRSRPSVLVVTLAVSLCMPSLSYGADKADPPAYDQVVSEIRDADLSSDANLRKLVSVSRGMFFGDRRLQKLNAEQKKEVQSLAARRYQEWEDSYIREKELALQALGNTAEDLEEVEAVSGTPTLFGFGASGGSEFLSPRGMERLRHLADARTKAIAEEVARPAVERVRALPEGIDSVSVLDEVLGQIPDDYRKGRHYGDLRKEIAEKRNRIVKNHRQALCDEALEDLAAPPETASLPVFPGLPLRDFVCGAAKSGVKVSYVESGFWPFAKTSSLDVSLLDPRTKISETVVKHGQTVSVELARTEIGKGMFEGPALIGVKRRDGASEHNMTLEDWFDFAGSVGMARPWYGTGQSSFGW
jgi:hypothetical protein